MQFWNRLPYIITEIIILIYYKQYSPMRITVSGWYNNLWLTWNDIATWVYEFWCCRCENINCSQLGFKICNKKTDYHSEDVILFENTFCRSHPMYSYFVSPHNPKHFVLFLLWFLHIRIAFSTIPCLLLFFYTKL